MRRHVVAVWLEHLVLEEFILEASREGFDEEFCVWSDIKCLLGINICLLTDGVSS